MFEEHELSAARSNLAEVVKLWSGHDLDDHNLKFSFKSAAVKKSDVTEDLDMLLASLARRLLDENMYLISQRSTHILGPNTLWLQVDFVRSS